MGEDYENEKATYVYEMLTAARYPVVIDPSLRLRKDGGFTSPLVVTHDTYNQTLSALINEIVHADVAVEVAALLYVLPDDRQRRPVPQWLLRTQAAQARTATGHAPASPGSDETEPSHPAGPQSPRRTR